MTVRKITIIDDNELRKQIDEIYESQNEVVLAKWALEIAKHIIQMIDLDISKYPEIEEGFKINELWQKKRARMYDVRKVGFKIHRIAREQNDPIKETLFRVIGQAVSSGHMKEHAMVASDYAIKLINLLSSNNIETVKKERMWQRNKLLELIDSDKE